MTQQDKNLCMYITENNYLKTGESLNCGANPNYLDQYDKKPIELAILNNNLPITMLLINRGAAITDEVKIYLNQQLCSAIWNANTAEAIRLIDVGADIDYVDGFGWSPIHLALNRGNLLIAKILARKGANLNKISENEEYKSPDQIISEFRLDIDLNNITLDKYAKKQVLFYFRGDDIDNFDNTSLNSTHNIFRADVLGKYFRVQEYTDFYKMLDVIETQSQELDKVNVLFNTHGVPEVKHLRLYSKKRHEVEIYSFGIKSKTEGYQHINSFALKNCEEVIKKASNKKVTILSLACFGERLFDNDFSSNVKVSPGSMIITLSNNDAESFAIDEVHPDVVPMLEAASVNRNGSMSLEDLLPIFCLVKRFTYNVPKIRKFTEEGSVDIGLEEHLQDAQIDISKLPLIEDLMHVKGLNKHYISDLMTQIREGGNLAKHFYKVPYDQMQLQHLKESDRKALLEYLAPYYANSIEEYNTESLHSLFLTNSMQNQIFAPLMYSGNNFYLTCIPNGIGFDENNSASFALPKNSILLGVSADSLVHDM